MLSVGTISYNIYCNFTNYGSALQTWALHQAVKKLGYDPVLVDYCPDILADKDPLNPFAAMWDKDEESKRMAALTMPAIRENYMKFDRFYRERFKRTAEKYTSRNFESITEKENIDSFICGSDTIFCPDEFGFDDGYYAEYESMRGHSVSYAASFGDTHFTSAMYDALNKRISNFLALGIRESAMLPYLRSHTDVPVQQVFDPTLLLDPQEYEAISDHSHEDDRYLLLYSRRYLPDMENFAERLAESCGLKIIDISLRAVNAERGHKMAYNAGVEEFLSLVRNAEYVVTNSYHGIIFSIQFRRPFTAFIRDQASVKITELLSLLGLQSRVYSSDNEIYSGIDYDSVFQRIGTVRKNSMDFLKTSLELLREKAYVS